MPYSTPGFVWRTSSGERDGLVRAPRGKRTAYEQNPEIVRDAAAEADTEVDEPQPEEGTA